MVVGPVGAESALCLSLPTCGAALAVGLATGLALAAGQGNEEAGKSSAEFRECGGCPDDDRDPAGPVQHGLVQG